MIQSPLFKRNFFILFSVIAIFFAVALASSSYYMAYEKEKNFSPYPQMIAALLGEIEHDPVAAIAEITNNPQISKTHVFDLIDIDGNSLLTPGKNLQYPLTAAEIARLKRGDAVRKELGYPSRPAIIVPSNRAGAYFHIAVKPEYRSEPPLVLVHFISLIACTTLAIGIALYIMFFNYRKKSREAHSVLAAIRKGDLKARVKADSMDELKPLINSFNEMADEVESLVESLRKTDQVRRRLLQDLAHDLKTPLASMRAFLETLQDSAGKIEESQRREALNYCLNEVDYFSSLVEDLLFLAQISEPNYLREKGTIDTVGEIQSLAEIFQAQSRGKIIEVDSAQEPLTLTGSKKLFERLIRNALANAVSFAQEKVKISVYGENGSVCIDIEDDGPGFSEESLQNYGVKQHGRKFAAGTGLRRISLGIGSLIMKEIVHAHRGHLHPSNKTTGGALVHIDLPRNF